MDYVGLLGAALAGTVLSSLLACLPALHIYNVAGLLILLAPRLEGLLLGVDGRPATEMRVHLIDDQGRDLAQVATSEDGLYSFKGTNWRRSDIFDRI